MPVRARTPPRPMRFDGDVEPEPRIAQVKHLTRNVLDNLAEEQADAQAEIALGKHSEITIRLRRATRRCQPA